MTSHLREYAEHYSVLALILSGGLIAVVAMRMNLGLEQAVIWSLSGVYVLWGIVHHLIRKDLTGFIVLEYVLVGVIAATVGSAVVAQK